MIEDLCGVPRTPPHTQRAQRCSSAVSVCGRLRLGPSSWQSRLVDRARVDRANDFARLIAAPGHRARLLNGATAAALYHRLVVPTLDAAATPLRYVVLPSTSPAHASMRYAEKLERWRAVTTAAAARRKT